MEITINIPTNTYSVPTEIRQEAVQAICDAFLYGGCDRCFHPYHDGVRTATRCAYRKPKAVNQYGKPVDGRGWFYGFESKSRCERNGIEFYEIRGCEMKAAFEALRKAGYHMFRVRYYGTWMGYVAYEKPYFRDGDTVGTEVSEFTDFID